MRAGAVLILGLVGALLAPLPATAVPPGSPADLTVRQPNDATSILSWAPVVGADRYDVSVDDDPSFGSPYASVRTANTTYVPTMNLKSGRNYWRVRSVSGSETSEWSSGDFGNAEVSVPVPASPIDGKTLEQPANPPLLSWSPSPGAVSYTVEVDGDSDFVGSSTYTTQSTSLVVPDPLGDGDWFWRVTASKGAGLVSLPSDASSFWIAPIAAPVISSPPDDSNHELRDVVLDWDPVPGAKTYDVQVATNTDFSAGGSLTETRNGILGTRYSPLTTYDNDQYFWRVRAVDLAGQATPWTAARSNFSRTWPHVPTPVFPADPTLETVRTPAFFQWTSVRHASEYEIQVGTQENFSVGTFQSCRTAGTTYTPGMFAINTNGLPSTFRVNEDCEPRAGQTNYWRVRPLDRPFTKTGDIDGVQGIFSDTQAFFYQPANITGMSPTGGETVDVPTLTWEPAVGAETYHVRVLRANSTVADSATTSSTSYTVDGTQPLKTTDNPHRWEITATTAEGQKSVTYTNYFNVSGGLPTSDQPALTLLTPTSTTSGIQEAPSMTWAPLPGAHHYSVDVGHARDTEQVWFGHNFDDLFGQSLPYPAMTDTGKRLLLPGTYDWRVTAYAADNTVLRVGPEARFTVQPLAATTGHAVAIDGQAVTGTGESPCTPASGDCTVPTTPVLRWQPDPRASFYMVYVSEDASFTNLLEPSNAIPATTNSMYAPALDNRDHTYPDNQAGQAYHWFVRPCRTVLNCGPDPVSTTGMSQHSFVKRSPSVTGLSSSSPAGTEITFSWDDYWDTNRAATWGQTGEQRPQAAKQYRIQVDDDQSFAGTLVDERLVDQTTYTAFDRLYPEGTYFWRVQAVDSDDNGLAWSDKDTATPWSEPETFTKQSPQVELTSPVGNQAVPGTSPFRWQSQAFASSYDVEVYKGNDATFSSTNRVFSKTVKTAAYAHTAPLPSSLQSYIWRVRRNDAAGNKGPWSQPGRFVVDSAVVDITSPALGGSQPPNGPVLSWTPLSGATSYTVEVRPATGSGTTTAATTVAASFATTTVFPTGSYTWTVTAKDAGGNVVGSGQSTFSVDAQLVSIQAVQIDTPGGTAVGQTLTSTPPTWNQPDVTNTYQWRANGNIIYGHTGPTYQIAAADYGKVITLRVTGKKPGYSDGLSESTGVSVTAGDGLVAITPPTITGTAKVNSSLQVDKGEWTGPPSSYSYQWFRGGTAVANAIGQSYWLRAEDAGRSISVRVTAKKAGYADGNHTTRAVAVAKLSSSTTASLSTSRTTPRRRVKMSVTVSAPGIPGPTGTILVKKGTRTIQKVVLSSDRAGRITTTLPRMRRGRYSLQAVYRGNDQVSGSRSARMRLVVR